MGFGKPDSIIYTNIGNCPVADKRPRAAGGNDWFKAETIIRKSHQRGADELIHRSIKELATKEQLPFKSFGMNRAYYFILFYTLYFRGIQTGCYCRGHSSYRLSQYIQKEAY